MRCIYTKRVFLEIFWNMHKMMNILFCFFPFEKTSGPFLPSFHNRCKKQLCKGDPRNFALLLHWDGFQASRTTQKDCGVVEIKILNGGKNSIINILPVLFIPFSCKEIIKNSSNVFSAFLRPLIKELEELYIAGIKVMYNYPVEQIFDDPFGHTMKCKVRGMLMMVTGDHPAQCKIGLFKDGGQYFCRRDKA